MSKDLRINKEIRAKQVRVISDAGEQLGILGTKEALAIAEEKDLDLVEVSPNTDPPVCKLMDYGKFKYEQAKKERDSKVKRKTLEVKEVKLRPKIDEHDFQVKSKIAERILKGGDKVKVTLMFRGREVVYTKLGEKLMERLFEEVAPLCLVEKKPKLEGRNMIMILAPKATPAP
ncbi:MAG: translation initiation factor IF-3 [Candidatus Eremiobacteraeota bacterium]|nr:translation initiation factor IF-3 [Candidatus Eremiobacteraeota bacterium]